MRRIKALVRGLPPDSALRSSLIAQADEAAAKERRRPSTPADVRRFMRQGKRRRSA